MTGLRALWEHLCVIFLELYLSAIQFGVWLRFGRLRYIYIYFEFRVEPVAIMQVRIDHLPAICINHKSLDTILTKGSVKYQANSPPLLSLLCNFFYIYNYLRALDLPLAWFSLCFGLKQAHCFVLLFLYSHICLVRFKLLIYNWDVLAFLKEQNNCVCRRVFEKLGRIINLVRVVGHNCLQIHN